MAKEHLVYAGDMVRLVIRGYGMLSVSADHLMTRLQNDLELTGAEKPQFDPEPKPEAAKKAKKAAKKAAKKSAPKRVSKSLE